MLFVNIYEYKYFNYLFFQPTEERVSASQLVNEDVDDPKRAVSVLLEAIEFRNNNIIEVINIKLISIK